MPRNLGILLIIWNILLSAMVGWSFFRGATQATEETVTSGIEGSVADSGTEATVRTALDSTERKNARIGYFDMVKLREELQLFTDRKSSLESARTRLQKKVADQQAIAEARGRQILSKDPTYSTKAEMESDQAELVRLEEDFRRTQGDAQDELARLEERYLIEFSEELQSFLKEYNATQNFDYLISMEPGGQVWPGNENLEVSDEIIAGMNARYAASKKEPVIKK